MRFYHDFNVGTSAQSAHHRSKESKGNTCMAFEKILDAIHHGTILIVHASFRACWAEGLTPETVIEALQQRLGLDGTLVMPTFSYNYSGVWNVSAYDPAVTPGISNGILSETFRKTPGVLRSGNPTYSVAAWGKYARLLTAGSRDNAGLGHGSSYENALKLGAKILLLNVGNNRNSMLHYAEAASGIPYNDIPFRECWGRTAVTIHGKMELIPEFPACSEAFSRFDDIFVREGIAQKLGGSYLIDAEAMVEFVKKEIHKQPDIMLCRHFTCEPCTLRRRRLRTQGLI